ncbi:ABC transporter substrate-binding protein [Nocardiopsis sp. NPDC058631]|uniref:ABC transporter substrate-binding protein n=1 Tax=Nocardiopsis sp. NPDC058631 TaxID=3346566 RepID=UPI003656139D
MTQQTTRLRGGTLTATGLALALALTACGDGETGGEADAATQGTVTVETDYGPVEIPAAPESVVALEFGNEVLLEAGIEPAGVIEPNTSLYTEDQLGVLESAPAVQAMSLELNLEALAATEPDLIIGGVREVGHGDYEDHFEDLSQIAPTVLFDFDGAGAELRDMTLELAEVVGDGERAEDERETFEARTAEIGETYADQLADHTFAVVFGVDNEFAVVNTNAWGALILDELGARPTAATEPAGEEFAAWYSYENLDELGDADVVFYETDVTREPDPFTADLLDQELWGTLPAVEDEQVHPLRHSFSRTYAQANDVLDQVEDVLRGL